MRCTMRTGMATTIMRMRTIRMHGDRRRSCRARRGRRHEPHAHDPGAEEVKHGTAGYHPHESPITMLIPLGVLALGAIFAGFLFHLPFLDAEHGAEFWKGRSRSTRI